MTTEHHQSFKLTLSYEGTAYFGWQSQTGGNTIQQVLESAITQVVGSRTPVTGSGRTDAGVHALGQVVSFSTATRLSAQEMQNALNANLPHDIRVLDAALVEAGFCALRSATRKRYVYRIQDGRQADLFRRHYCWFVRGDLDVDMMQTAANHLLGEHDFASFQGAGSERASTTRRVLRLHVDRRAYDHHSTAPDDIMIEICANGFLYRMVRNIVGTLVEVGLHRRPVGWVAEVLAAGDRNAAGRTAPPHGLFLMEVNYD